MVMDPSSDAGHGQRRCGGRWERRPFERQCTVLVAQSLGPERMADWFDRFGLGRPSGMDFPGESAGSLRPIEEWSATDIGALPLGQGVAVTAVQMLGAYNAIANGGTLVEPTVVRASIDRDGVEHLEPEAARRQVVSSETARSVTEMLVGVVDGGTGTNARIEGYRVAGKTGTAYKALPEGGYRDTAGRYHYTASFAGFVPADDPRLSAIVVLDQPEPHFGGEAAAPVFARIARYGLRQLAVPPTLAPVPVARPTAAPPPPN